MTSLNEITKEVPASSLKIDEPVSKKVTIEKIIEDILLLVKPTEEEKSVFHQGLISERNKVSNTQKSILDTILYILSQDDPKIDNPTELLIHKQNKKFTRNNLITLLSGLSVYNIDDKKFKLLALGKLLQSIYEVSK